MIEDQKYILGEILELIDGQLADAVIIAGDIYDKPVPSAEAMELFDSFLVSLAERGLKVFVIAGNHDSVERIAFGARLMDKGGVYLSPVYNGQLSPVKLKDEFGIINVYMLPFIKPVHVRNCFPDEEINSLNDAVACAVKHMGADMGERNLLITHQFVSGAESCESEISVGGTDAVDKSVFEGFDYVALGHIHGPQNIGSERIRYCGTPLKYSFSEAEHKKSLTVVEMGEKGNVSISTIPLSPMRDMLKLRGSYDQLMSHSFYAGTKYREAYLQITLTDEEELPGALSYLRVIYPNIMKLDYDNIRSRESAIIEGLEDFHEKSPLEIFSELYELQNNQTMSDKQRNYIKALIEKEAE